MGGKIITEFVALRPKTYSYLDDNCNEHKKAKGTKKWVIKQRTIFQNFKDCLFNNKNVYSSQERFKGYNHDVYTEEVDKIAFSSIDDKRLQTFDRIRTYPYGTNVFKICENEMLMVKDLFFEKKMINFDNCVNENKTKHNESWPYIPDHPYRILIIGDSGSGKTNLLLTLIEINQTLIKYIYMQKIHMNQDINI